MAEQEGAGIDPEQYFNEGVSTGQEIGVEETLGQVAEKFAEAGYDPDEINELLYDPAPRRRRRHVRRASNGAPRRRRSHRRVAMYDPAPRRRHRRRTYDPAPKRYASRGSGALGGLLNYAGIIAGGAKFVLDYQARAKALGVNPTTGLPHTILTAIEFDMKNFNASDAMTRVTGALPTIVVEAVAGYALKSRKINAALKGYGRPAGDVALGVAAATLVKAFLDPPIGAPQQARMAQARIAQPTAQVAQARVVQTAPVPVYQPVVQQTSSTSSYNMEGY